MRRDKNGQFLSNQGLNCGGMKTAGREAVMANKQDLPMAEQADIIRHLIDGDINSADKMLKVLAAERRLEACNKALESLNETKVYYLERLARWKADVEKWKEGCDFHYDGTCYAGSKGMAELRLENFELYKKFLKAGKGIPYYKSYDISGVETTKISISNVNKGLAFLKRRIEEYEVQADLNAAEEDTIVPNLGFNVDHWAWTKEMSWRKVIDIQANVSNWSTSLLFRTLATIREKVANKEFTKGYSFWAQGLLFKELHARTERPDYYQQYQDMRVAWKAYQRIPDAPEVIPEDELELNLPAYELPQYSLTEDEMIYAIDHR